MVESVVQSHAEIVVGSNEKLIRVLHVDDELGFLKVAKQCLELQGPFHVDTAGSVEEALNKLKEKEYDAVVSDYQMPGKDGLEFLEMLRKNGNTIPFIMFTGKGREEVAVRAWSLGADYYVNKTGDPETVYCELAHCLRSTVEKHFAEAQMKETVQKLQTIYQNAVEGISYVDSEENIVYANKAFADIVGYEQEQLAGMNLRRFVDEESWAKIRTETEKHLKGKANRYELIFRRTDGTTRNVQISGSPLFDSDGGFAGTVGIVLDVTASKNAEETAKESEEKWHSLFEMAPDGMATTDMKGVITSVNSAFLRLTGYKREDIVGKRFTKLQTIKPKDIPKYLKLMISALRGRLPEPFEYSYVRKDGTIGWGEAHVGSLKKNSKTIGYQMIFREITERKKAEEVLQKSEETLNTLMEEAPIGICNTDLKGKITYVNKRFEEATGYSREEIVGKNGFKFGIMSNEISKSLAKRMKERLMGKPSRILEGQFKRKDGEWIWAEVEGRLIKKFGVPVGFQLTTRDITERKRAEKERKRYEERLSALHIHSWKLNTAESMEEIYRLTMDAVEKTLGFEIAFFMVVDKDMLRLVDHRGYPEPFSIKLPLNGTKKGVSVKVAKTGRSINVPDAEKEDAWVEFMPSIRSGLDVPVKIGSKVLGVIGVDSKELNAFNEKDQELLEILASHAATAISNLDRARELEAYAREIRESQQMFERLFIDDPEAAVHLDSSFHILNVNPRFSRLFDYSLDEVKGTHINDVIVPKDKMEEAAVLDERASKGEIYHEDTIRKRKDGSLVSVALSAAPVIIENQVIGHIAVYKDISQLKKAEDELKKMLQKLDKMNEKLRVVGGLTRHDVRNKLSTITTNAYLLKKQLAGNSEALDKLGDMEKAVQQTVKIFDFAKAYEMLGAEELVYNDVEKTVNEAISLFANRNNIKVINDCHGLTILADSLLRQLFYNLIDNSLKYGQKTARIRVYYEKTGQDSLKLVYEDDGIGIPVAEKPKLFKEGYSTGGSTGYGLYLIKKMMEVYGWTIQETGTPGKGVLFTMVIPEKNQDGKENYRLH